MWERALRKASVPVAHTEGFSPRPKLSFGLALPTACESLAEYLDIELAAPTDPDQVRGRLEGQFPVGIEVTGGMELERGGGSLQQDVTSCTWEITVPGLDRASLDPVVKRALEAPALSVQRMRKGKNQEDDLRPAVLELESFDSEDRGCVLRAELGTRPRGVRPSELGRALGIELGVARRTHQWIENEGSRKEPLSQYAARPVVASERAS
jgi:radical SAM-linked protein